MSEHKSSGATGVASAPSGLPPAAAVAVPTDKPAANCATCRALCCRLTVVLTPGDAVPPALTATLASGLPVMARGEDGWCVAVDRVHMRCSIYAQRPSACRRFAMNGPYCRSVRDDDVQAPGHGGDAPA